MKAYSYYLFPVFFRVLGFLALGIAVFSIFFAIDYSNLDEEYYTLIGAMGFLFFAIVFLTFKGRFIIDKERMQIIKENKVLGFQLSKDIVKVPGKVSQVIIHQNTKQGKSYVQAAVGFTYMLKSSDVYFDSEFGAVKLISTDHERAIIIAELIKDQLNLNYTIKLSAST